MRTPIKVANPPVQNVDRHIVRFDRATIDTAELPPLTLPARNIADRGIVRLGSTGITSER